MNFTEKKDSSGIITTSDIVGKCSKSDYYKYLKKNSFEKVEPGVYASSAALLDMYTIVHRRSPQAVISHDIALYHYRLVENHLYLQ